MQATPPQPRPWWVGIVSGMASYIDAAAIVSFGIAIVIYQIVFGFDAAQVGIASAVLTLGIAVGALFGGKLGDRFGRRPVFSATMIVIAVGAAFLVFGDSFALILVGAALVGLGTGADLPVSLSTISEAATDANRGRILAFSNILWLAGIVVSILLGTALGNLGRFGAQIIFAHIGVMALLVLVGRFTIPESTNWIAARDERRSGVETVRADRAKVRDLLRTPYLVPLLALIAFYALVNLSFNTFGQFGPYLLVSAAGLDVSTASSIGLIALPIGAVTLLIFMRFADRPVRFALFVAGAIVAVLGSLVPVVFGFSAVTYIVALMMMAVGASFAGEAIMKIWTQEQFPTLLRTTAQGTIISVARFAAAGGAAITPLVASAGTGILFGALAVVNAVGLLIAFLVFRTRDRRNEFHSETRADATRLTETAA